jgi:hypothetical protein
MVRQFSVFALAILTACSGQQSDELPPASADTIQTTVAASPEEHPDSVLKDHPELTADWPREPDQLYSCQQDQRFDSEVGADSYFTLYATVWKKKNGENKFQEQRKKLTVAFSAINSMFASIQGGGTFFGHQTARIPAYVEYSIWLYAEGNGKFDKTYDFTVQKTLYIQSLRQLLKDEFSINNSLSAKDKSLMLSEVTEHIANIEYNITDLFTLRRVQEFHYSEYGYY